jgi:hypothetical protein
MINYFIPYNGFVGFEALGHCDITFDEWILKGPSS